MNLVSRLFSNPYAATPHQPQEPVPGTGPTAPTGPRNPFPPMDGVDLTFAKTVVTCEEGTHPVVKTEGQTTTVTCEPDAPKPSQKQGKRNVPIID
jgi:hypothetical protein